jgi:hypothetical protein
MNLKNCIDKLNRLISGKKIEPQLKARMKAIQAEFAAMSDEELRAIASKESSEEFTGMSDEELFEIIARES